jgi:branched-chain amino acid transport system permease protein
VIAGAVFVGIAVYLILERSRLGRQVTAVGTDPEGAIVLGISLRRISQFVMVLSALSAAVVGLTVAPLLLVSPTFGFSLTFIGFAAAAIGGLGSVKGSFLGGYLVALVIQLTAVYWTPTWTNTMVFGVLVAVYAIRPWGVFGHRPARMV